MQYGNHHSFRVLTSDDFGKSRVMPKTQGSPSDCAEIW